jgi:hypothetical protein
VCYDIDMRSSICTSIILAVVLVIVASTITYRFVLSPPRLSDPFPLDKTDADYWIEKQNRSYLVVYSYKGQRGGWVVGKSRIELEPYVGKRVEIVGEYPHSQSEYPSFTSRYQCIVDQCHEISDWPNLDAITVNINELKLK